MHKGSIAACTCQCFHIGFENELVSSAVLFALKYPLITQDLSCDYKFEESAFNLHCSDKLKNIIIMSPDKIVASIERGHSSMLSWDGFDSLLNTEKERKQIQQKKWIFLKSHLCWWKCICCYQNPHNYAPCKSKDRTNMSKSLVKHHLPLLSLCKLGRNVYFQLESSTRDMNSWNKGDCGGWLLCPDKIYSKSWCTFDLLASEN